MQLVSLQQSTPEWLEWRRGGITASDISCLFGSNPWKTEWRLWAEKSGIEAEDDIEGNPYVRRGRMFEHMLRERIASDRRIGLFPVCATHDTHRRIRASLDAIDPQRRPWEMKIPSPGNWQRVLKDGLSSEPAQRCLLQLQHQMLVTGSAEGFLVFGDLDDDWSSPAIREYRIFVIAADPDIHAEIVRKAEVFLHAVDNGVEPQRDPMRDLFAPRSASDVQDWQQSAARLIPLLDRKAALRKSLKEVEDAIETASDPILRILGPNKTGQFSGIRAVQVERQGTVNWKSLVTSLGADPDDPATTGPFRKAPTYHVQVSFVDKAD